MTHFLSVDDLFGALHGPGGSLDQNSPGPSEKHRQLLAHFHLPGRRLLAKAEDYENTKITKMQKILCVLSSHECTKRNIAGLSLTHFLCQLAPVHIDFSVCFLLKRTPCALVIAETEVCHILEIFKLWLQRRPRNNPRSFACFREDRCGVSPKGAVIR